MSMLRPPAADAAAQITSLRPPCRVPARAYVVPAAAPSSLPRPTRRPAERESAVCPCEAPPAASAAAQNTSVQPPCLVPAHAHVYPAATPPTPLAPHAVLQKYIHRCLGPRPGCCKAWPTCQPMQPMQPMQLLKHNVSDRVERIPRQAMWASPGFHMAGILSGAGAPGNVHT